MSETQVKICDSLWWQFCLKLKRKHMNNNNNIKLRINVCHVNTLHYFFHKSKWAAASALSALVFWPWTDDKKKRTVRQVWIKSNATKQRPLGRRMLAASCVETLFVCFSLKRAAAFTRLPIDACGLRDTHLHTSGRSLNQTWRNKIIITSSLLFHSSFFLLFYLASTGGHYRQIFFFF